MIRTKDQLRKKKVKADKIRETKFQAYKALQLMVKHLNEGFRYYGVPGDIFSVGELQEVNGLPVYKGIGQNSYLTREQCYTVAHLCAKASNHGTPKFRVVGNTLHVGYTAGEKFVVIGSMQLGKSAIICAAFIIMPILHEMLSESEQECIGFITLTPQRSLRRQFLIDLHNTWKLFSNIKFDGETAAAYYADKGIDNPCDHAVISRVSAKIEDFREMVEAKLKLGYMVLHFVDESHYGQDEQGVAHRMERGIENQMVQVGISATPSEQLADSKEGHDSKWHKVPAFVGKSYIGPRKWQKIELPSLDGSTEQLPDLRAYEDYFLTPILGIRMFKTNYNCYFHPNKWKDKVSGRLPTPTEKRAALAYCQRAAAQVVSNLRTLYVKRPGGVFLRTGLNTEMTMWLIEQIENAKPPLELNAEIIRFYGTDKEPKSVKNLIEAAVSEGGNYLVVAVAKARMGDSFPNSCRTFIDFTVGNNNHFHAMYQGTFGRACGHGKDSLVLLHQDFVGRLRTVIANGGDHRGVYVNGQYSKRVRRRGGSPGRPSQQFMLDVQRHCRNDPFLRQLMEKLSEWKEGFIRVDEDVSAEFKMIVDDRVYDYLEGKFGIRLARWGQKDSFKAGGRLTGVTVRRASTREQYLETQKASAAHHHGGRIMQQVVYKDGTSEILFLNLRLADTKRYPTTDEMKNGTTTDSTNTHESRY
jgi:hypothetical protein